MIDKDIEPLNYSNYADFLKPEGIEPKFIADSDSNISNTSTTSTNKVESKPKKTPGNTYKFKFPNYNKSFSPFNSPFIYDKTKLQNPFIIDSIHTESNSTNKLNEYTKELKGIYNKKIKDLKISFPVNMTVGDMTVGDTWKSKNKLSIINQTLTVQYDQLKIISPIEMIIGQIGFMYKCRFHPHFEGNLMMRTYSNFVNLNNPNMTWETTLKSYYFLIKLLPKGSIITLEADVE